MKKVYFDNAATTPTNNKVLEEMAPFLKEQFGNPSSLHEFGEAPKKAVSEARGRVAKLIGGEAGRIIFTSSGSEANNLAIKGIALANRKKGNHIIVSQIEHFSVFNPAKTLEKSGFEVTFLPVDGDGVVNPDDVKQAIKKETILVSVMFANNEIGTIEPIKEIVKITKEREVIFHTDAVAAAGIIPINTGDLGIDSLSLAGNMFFGPKGSGALYLAKGVKVIPQIEGGIQEEGRRAGTENVAAIAGLGKAAEIALKKQRERMDYLIPLRERLSKGLLEKIEHSFLTGHPKSRLPGHVSICIKFIEGESMLMFLSMEGIAASSGSACTSRALKASHVLMAIGLPHEVAHGSLVFSLSSKNNKEEV
ncbi:MAG: aminotransferase class V-fold PLP-dependent enzyme, partial [Actinomycetia bacterium]|nr:aminotransferase class V-fold PLP-dependent enzyme [Actinomycetes bacterium]